MKRVNYLVALLLAGTSIVAQSPSATSLPTVKTQQTQIKPVPPILAKTIDGKTLRFDQFKGKVVILNFWATWCPPCVAEIPELIDLQKKMGNSVQIIGISMDDDVADVKHFVAKTRFSYPIVMANDDITSKFPRISAIPTSVIINKNGMISDIFSGYRNPQFFKDTINRYSK